MPESASKAGKTRGKDLATEAERVPVGQAEGTERTEQRPVYAPRVDIIETADALEIFADVAGATRDSVEVTLEQRVLSIRARGDLSLPGDLAPKVGQRACGTPRSSSTPRCPTSGSSARR